MSASSELRGSIEELKGRIRVGRMKLDSMKKEVIILSEYIEDNEFILSLFIDALKSLVEFKESNHDAVRGTD